MSDAAQRLRWDTVEEEATLPGLVERVTHPEFRDVEFLHVRAKSLLNHVPQAAGLPFEWTINVYRGCTHACSYCLSGDTPILMADGRSKPLKDVKVGDDVVGTRQGPTYRHYATSRVLDHWATSKRAWRISLEDGTELIASGDHRFLTDRGFKHVTGREQGAARRPHLTTNNTLMGVGGFAPPPKEDRAYRRGYLAGMIRGDGHVGTYEYDREGRSHGTVHRFRLALADGEALGRTRRYLAREGIDTVRFVFTEATARRRGLGAIRTSAGDAVDTIRDLISLPTTPSRNWRRGFLAGIFDAEGGTSRGIFRISNRDRELIRAITTSLDEFGFRYRLETRKGRPRLRTVRLLGGLVEQLRFFHSTDPAIVRKRQIQGKAVKSRAKLGVTSVEPLEVVLPMYDITTTTGDFIADGVVSHNCFARPTHTYLDLNADEDFDRVIVVKVNAVQRLRAELRRPSWEGEHVALGTNTDPYQRAEGRYRLTRGVLETLTLAGNPFSVLTKSPLALRDLDILTDAQARTGTAVNVSVGTLDEDAWRATEPGTPHPRKRIEAVAELNEAGVPSGVMVAPIIPGLTDGEEQLREVVVAAVDAGASFVTPIPLHLRSGVREVFFRRTAEDRPDLLPHLGRVYEDRAYAPPAERRRISAIVRRLVREAGGIDSPAPPRPGAGRPESGPDPDPQPAHEQASLPL